MGEIFDTLLEAKVLSRIGEPRIVLLPEAMIGRLASLVFCPRILAMRKPLTCALLCLVWAIDVRAWGPAGHKIVASVAFRKLSLEKTTKVIALLKKHPRYAEDFAAKVPAELKEGDSGEWIMQQAAIWPDLAKGLQGGLKVQYSHGSWHYIDLPYYLDNGDEEALTDRVKNVNVSLVVPQDPGAQKTMNVVQAIAHSKSIAFDSNADPQDRALHLSWLLHLVGDVHQPLHSTALFSRKLFPDGDLGGNKIHTEQRENLHTLWDEIPGSPGFTTTRNKAIGYMKDEQMQALGEQAANVDDVTKWLEESHSLAITAAYDSEVTGFLRKLEQNPSDAELPKISLSEGYLKRGGEIANRRVVQAGYRLAKMLEALP
jgi:S1/P1 Nuclease